VCIKEGEASESQRDGVVQDYILITDHPPNGGYQAHSSPSSSCVLLPSSKPSLKEPDLLMVRVFSSSDMQEFLSRLSVQGSKETSWLVRLLLRRPVRLIWAAEVGLDAVGIYIHTYIINYMSSKEVLCVCIFRLVFKMWENVGSNFQKSKETPPYCWFCPKTSLQGYETEKSSAHIWEATFWPSTGHI